MPPVLRAVPAPVNIGAEPGGVDRATWDLLQVPLNEGAKLTAAQMFLLANPGIALLHVVHFEDNMPACTVYWQAAPLIFHCA